MASASESLVQAMDKIAESVVMLDLRDLPGLAALAKGLNGLGASLSAQDGNAGEAAKAAGHLVEQIILEETKEPEKAWDTVVAAVSALQGSVAGRKDVEFPAGLGLKAVASAVTGLKADAGGLPVGVDEDILKAFVDQQLSVLPEIEAGILAVEKGGDGEALAALRRIIHTMKGEAGVVGMNEIQRVCHAMEDCLDSRRGGSSTDTLLKVKDWLDEAVACMAAGAPIPSGDAAIKLLTAEASASSRPAAGKSPAPTKVEAPESPAASPVPEPAAPAVPVADMPGFAVSDPDLARDFVAESREHFELADDGLLTLERDPADKESVAAVFRAFHTIKGVSGFLGLPPISDLAHAAETLLDDVRRGKRTFQGRVSDVTFAALDMLKALVGDLGKVLMTGGSFYARPSLPILLGDLKLVIAGSDAPLHSLADVPSARPEKPASAAAPAAVPAAASAVVNESAAPKPAAPAAGGAGLAEAMHPASEAAVPGAARSSEEGGDGGVKQTVKVDADRLDLLIDNIGELVIAQSIVAQDPEIRGLRDLRVQKNLAHLTKITRALQDMGMSMRMTPIEPTFRKMARLVRDLAKKANKQVEFAMVGKETELDRGMVDKLGDPLVHMIRNSVDHGIEASPEDRRAAGKDPVGHVTLRAFHKGGGIHIAIEDDGRGLNREALIAKGIERGMVKPEDRLSDQEAYSLIFAPGFSTAKQITEISGRGVGMDVVRRNIESLRGNVLIDTVLGKGTTFTLVLPLTMAIIDGMAVKVDSETYIVPTLSVIESMRPTPDMISTVTGKGEMIAFRGHFLPLFRLAKTFRIKGAVQDPCAGIVVVVEDSGRQIGLLVDEILGQQQTVIKSMGDALGIVPGVSGASILADGRPGLILDIGGLVKMARE
jgi:two-component system chemotaxis sensor kinase CheA